jgi:hypothetical protein
MLIQDLFGLIHSEERCDNVHQILTHLKLSFACAASSSLLRPCVFHHDD